MNEIILPPIKTENLEKLNLVVSKDEAAKIRKAAEKRNLSISRFLRLAAVEKLKRIENESVKR